MRLGGPETRRVGWNWAWVLPLSAAALFVVEMHTIPLALKLGSLARQRWSWGALISPSAYFCLAVTISSVILPVQGIVVIPSVLSSAPESGEAKRRLLALLLIVLVFCLPFITDALIWGSFPFNIDGTGTARLRLIPFLPWPDAPFGQY
jgi:hypothetical protein